MVDVSMPDDRSRGEREARLLAEAFGKPEESTSGISRRRFLVASGFTFMGALLFGCSRAPEETAFGYVEQPEGTVAGRTENYATTCAGCPAGCGILARSRDGRPIKLEGNPEHPLSRGGLCAIGQASLLGLYDSHRLDGPRIGGEAADWKEVDALLIGQFETARRGRGRVRYLSGPITSPTKQALIDEFLGGFADGRHVIYDPTHTASVLDAHERTHGRRVAPRVHLDRARDIVAVDADFLGTWGSPVESTASYASRRRADDPESFSRHVHFESRLSVTGSKADRRFVISPTERALVLQHLLVEIERLAGRSLSFRSLPASSVDGGEFQALARELWSHRGEVLVLCGADDLQAQIAANLLNVLLDSYGRTLDLQRPSYQLQGDESRLAETLEEIRRGTVDVVFVDGVNPVFDLPGGEDLRKSFASLGLLVSFAQRMDETASLADVICPDAHFLEAWSDARPVHGLIGFSQPLVRPLGHTRPVIESLDRWLGRGRDSRALLQARWGEGPQWEGWIEAGFAQIDEVAEPAASPRPLRPQPATGAPKDTLALVLYSKVGVPHGGHAYNPWLQELPDPITKAVWGNYACLAPSTAARLGVSNGDVVRVGVESGASIELPVLVQPGQHEMTVAVALGYGSELSRRFAGVGPEWIERRPTVGEDGRVGVNAAGLLGVSAPRRFSGAAVTVHPTGAREELARTQEYSYIDVPARLAPPSGARRPNIREVALGSLVADGEHTEHSGGEHAHASLWPEDHPHDGHHWAMAIDLTICTGCSACVIACQVENNVPVVGKDEIRRNREMHWLRIDRYYAETGTNEVDVAYQPMLCQHCDNAPCETVCPVLATVHSEEGLNQQVYNRCVGTRYCMNNCPYKVRRFNWFEYAHENELENLTLNPDVTVRSRGVMEKCSFCVQRIQEQKYEAKRRGHPLRDGAIRTACEQSCPAQAIVFGDRNDPDSRVAKLLADERHYRVLDELGVKPSVGYLTLVRNRTEKQEAPHHG